MKKMNKLFLSSIAILSLFMLGSCNNNNEEETYTECDYVVEGVKYKVSEENSSTLEVVGYTKDIEEKKDVVIKEEVSGKEVTKISNGAFKWSTITSVTIPSSVSEIERNAFAQCSSLTDVEIKGDLTTLGHYAFSWCDNLTNLTLPAKLPIQTAEDYENDIIKFGYNVFYATSNIKKVYYSGTLQDWLGLNFVDEYANPLINGAEFYMLDSTDKFVELKDLVVPETTTKIGNYQFAGFKNVKSIVLPITLTEIGNSSLLNCSSLEKIYYAGSQEEYQNIKIGTNNNLSEVEVEYNYKG